MTTTIKQYLRIGDNLKRIRESLGENQTTFAKRLKISRSTYSNYENNNRIPDDKTLQKISTSLEVSVNELMGVNEREAIVASKGSISNRVVQESIYDLLEEVLKNNREFFDLRIRVEKNMTAEEIINADNCYWQLLVSNVVNTIENSIQSFFYRKEHGKLKQRENELMLSIGEKKTFYPSGLVGVSGPVLIPLARRYKNKLYIQSQIDELQKKLDSLNLIEK